MSKHNVIELAGREKNRDELTELIRAAVVRNGYQPVRDIQTGIGPVSVKVPQSRWQAGELSFGAGATVCAQDCDRWKRRCPGCI